MSGELNGVHVSSYVCVFVSMYLMGTSWNFDVIDKRSCSPNPNGTIPYDPLCKDLQRIKETEFCPKQERCIKYEFEGYINRIKIMQFIQLISSALPVVHRLFSSFINKTAPITTKPTILHSG